MRQLLGVLAALVLAGCGPQTPRATGRFGEVTSAVVLVDNVGIP